MATDLHYSAYEAWVEKEGLPVYEGWGIHPPDLDLAPWPRKGVDAAILHLTAMGDHCNDFIMEISQGGSSKPIKQMHEEVIYVLKGQGATSVWVEGGAKHTFEWQAGSLFAIPMNAYHQHFNGSGTQAARFICVTNLPLMLNMFHSEDFIWNNPYQFRDRLGDAGYFAGEGKMHEAGAGRTWWETNLLADADHFELRPWKERGAGGINLQFNLANSAMHTHISEFPVGTYKKAHAHGPGAHIILLSGVGYSLCWPDGRHYMDSQGRARGDEGGVFDEHEFVPWKKGSIFVPMGFHQHFNAGQDPARYLAIGFGGMRYHVGQGAIGGRDAAEGMDKSFREGGFQQEYEDEDPRILEIFERECAKNDVESRMREILARA